MIPRGKRYTNEAKHEEMKGGLKEVENHRAVRISSHAPGPSIFVDMSRKSGPFAGGLGMWSPSAPCLFCLIYIVFHEKTEH